MYNNSYTFDFTEKQLQAVLKVIDPKTYTRLYKKYEHELGEFEKKQNKVDKETATSERVKEKYKAKLNEKIESIAKNLLALSLLFRAFVAANYDENKEKKIHLNLLLTYELYISLSHRLMVIENTLKKNEEFIRRGIEDSKEKTIAQCQREMQILPIEADELNKIINEIQSTVPRATMYRVEIDYPQLSVSKHLEYCYKQRPKN